MPWRCFVVQIQVVRQKGCPSEAAMGCPMRVSCPGAQLRLQQERRLPVRKFHRAERGCP